MTPEEHLEAQIARAGIVMGWHPRTRAAVLDAIHAAVLAERSRCAAIARAPRAGTWDAYSLAEAIAAEIERGTE